jgi:hypothetical protein
MSRAAISFVTRLRNDASQDVRPDRISGSAQSSYRLGDEARVVQQLPESIRVAAKNAASAAERMPELMAANSTRTSDVDPISKFRHT